VGRRDYMGLLILMVAAAVVPLFIDNDYHLGIFVFTALNCLACIGLSLLMGYAGQISLGHAAFVALGAYVSAILTAHHGWSAGSALCAGAFLSAAVAVLVGVPSLRLKGHYLAMATLGFGAIVHIVAVAAVDLTGGPEGVSGIPDLVLFGLPIDTDRRFFYFSWAAVVLGLFLALNLIHSRIGRGLRAIHGSEDAAGAAGVHTARYKIEIFVISAVYASVSGSLYAYYVNYIDPGPFDVMHSVLLVTMVAVGGMHRVWGAITGAVLLSLLPEFLSSLSHYFQKIGIEYTQDYDILVYGTILLLIMLFLPEGLFSGVGAVLRWLRDRVRGQSADGGDPRTHAA
jgi:branched-chain amino acid transport system permease protein